ncbi:MAG: carbonic anhydrase [Deltaproteobacteria bacterium]|nr:carbonic anhydrase [Deltaproteobacteria bacterium]
MEHNFFVLITTLLGFLSFFIFFSKSANAADMEPPRIPKPTSEQVSEILKNGNKRFYTGKSVYPNTDAARIMLANNENQKEHAYATIVSCSDSRVPVELIFDVGIMDVFVVRVAGNICHNNEIGTIEYGLTYVHTPLLIILGHTRCGAITAVTHALQGKEQRLARNIPHLVENIIPPVKKTFLRHPDLCGDDIIPYAIEENIWHVIETVFMRSPVVRHLVADGKVKVAGAMYDLATGKIEWFPFEKSDEILAKVEASPDKEIEPFAS